MPVIRPLQLAPHARKLKGPSRLGLVFNVENFTLRILDKVKILEEIVKMFEIHTTAWHYDFFDTIRIILLKFSNIIESAGIFIRAQIAGIEIGVLMVISFTVSESFDSFDVDPFTLTLNIPIHVAFKESKNGPRCTQPRDFMIKTSALEMSRLHMPIVASE